MKRNRIHYVTRQEIEILLFDDEVWSLDLGERADVAACFSNFREKVNHYALLNNDILKKGRHRLQCLAGDKPILIKHRFILIEPDFEKKRLLKTEVILEKRKQLRFIAQVSRPSQITETCCQLIELLSVMAEMKEF